jgi:hypothetical protein
MAEAFAAADILLEEEPDILELEEEDILVFDGDPDDNDLDYDDEYNMEGLGEVMGSMDINDYIGDLTNDSKILDFQDIDETIPDMDEELF